ncbi:MAG: hypothetical protein AAGA65_16520 [Actinomycetota bacterium]
METRQEQTQDWATELTSVRFAQVARQLGIQAKRDGLKSPAFRSPPRVSGVTRSIRRRADGSATVSVRLRGRPAVAVVADMIDGVMAANEHTTRSAALRDRLWSVAAPLLAVEDQDRPAVTVRSAADRSASGGQRAADRSVATQPPEKQTVDRRPEDPQEVERPPARRAA